VGGMCCIAIVVGVILTAGSAFARDQIQIAGSSTVLPYAKIVAETFGEIYPEHKIPVIESGGSGAGIKEFCRGIGENTIDIANTSRPMQPIELQACSYAGVKDIEEIHIGYDGIVFAADIDSPDWHLTLKDIYQALAARVLTDGQLQSNPVKKWNAINSNLPAWDIAVYIPGDKHGTRKIFEEKVMLQGCRESGVVDTLRASGMDDKAIEIACVSVRKDGMAFDIDGDSSEGFAHITSKKTGLAVLSLSFYKNNADRLKVATVNGVMPTEQTVASRQYSISRPLFFYVKKVHLDIIPGLRKYVEFFLSDQMIGPDGPLAEYGLVVAPQTVREVQRAAFESR